MKNVITQSHLVAILAYASENPTSVAKFYKNQPSAVIVVTPENQELISKKLRIVQNGEYPAINVEVDSIDVGTVDNADYKAEYFSENGLLKIGLGIMINVLKDGSLDIYPNANLKDAYIFSDAEVPNIKKLPDVLNQEVEMYLKTQEVTMMHTSIVKSIVGIDESAVVEIEATWGSQKDMGNDSYIVFNNDELYGINMEDGKPIGYLRVAS